MTLVVGGGCRLHLCRLSVVQLGVGGISVFPCLVIVTGRDLDVALDAVEVSAIIEIECKEPVAVPLRTVAVVAASCVVILVGFVWHIDVSPAARPVIAERKVGMESRQETEAVVRIEAADGTVDFACGVIVVKQSGRIPRGTVDRDAVGIGRLIVAEESIAAGIHRRAGIVRGTAPDGLRIGKTVVAASAFQIDVQLEAVIQEHGSERDAAGVAGHVVGPQYTVLAARTERQTVRYRTSPAGDAEVVVRSESGMEYFFVPVGVDTVVEQRLLAVIAVSAHQTVQLVTCNHVSRPGGSLEGVRRGERDLRADGTGALLGGDDDDTVGGTRSVDGRRGRILEDGHALDVVRIDETQEVSAAGNRPADLHGHAIEDNQRVVGRIERRTATDADRTAGRRRTAAADNLHTAHLAVDKCLGRIDDTLVEILAVHTRHRTGQVALALYAVADDDCLLQNMFVRFKRDGKRSAGRNLHRLRLVADVGNLKLGDPPVHIKGKTSVKVGDGSCPMGSFLYCCPDKGLPLIVCHRTSHPPDILCDGRHRDKKDKENHTEQAHCKIAFVNHIGF